MLAWQVPALGWHLCLCLLLEAGMSKDEGQTADQAKETQTYV